MPLIESFNQGDLLFSRKIEHSSVQDKKKQAITTNSEDFTPIIKPYTILTKREGLIPTQETKIELLPTIKPDTLDEEVSGFLLLPEEKKTISPVKISIKSKPDPEKITESTTQPEVKEVKTKFKTKLITRETQSKPLPYEVTLGFSKEEITNYLKSAFNLHNLTVTESRFEEIMKNTLSIKEQNKTFFYALEIKNPEQIPQILAKVSNLSELENKVLNEFFLELYKNQPILDIQNLINNIKKQFQPEIVKNLTEKDFLDFRKQIDAKLTWAYHNLNFAKNKKTNNTPNEAIFSNVVDLFDEKRKELLIFALEDLKKEINTALYDNVPEIYKVALDRIDVIKGDSKAPQITAFKDDDLEISLSKKQAILSNKSSGITAKLTFGDFQETLPTFNKISFHEDDAKLKESLQGLGIDLKEYATIAKVMPEIRYMNNDEDVPDTVVAKKFYEAITNLFKNQRNLPPGYYKHLENIKKYADTGDVAFKAACKMSILVNTIYAVLRVIGVASVMLFANGNTSLLDQIGSIGLFIGEFAIRVPASLQYNHIIYQTLATDNEKFNITQKELDEVRGKNGPPLGTIHYFYKEGFIFNGTVETTFLMSTGYWNFTAHHYAPGWSESDIQKQDGNRHKLRAWENEKDKFLKFINKLNIDVKDNWLKFENNISSAKKTKEKTFSEALNINTIKNFNDFSFEDLDFLKEETKRIAMLYQDLNKTYLLKEDFWRTRTNEYSRSLSMNVMWYSKIADTWGAHGKLFLNHIKENEFALNEIMNSEEPRKSALCKKYLEELRSQYKKLEHSYHHKIIIDYAQAYRKMNFETYNLINEKVQNALTENTKKTKVSDLIKNQAEIKNFTLVIN
ncbi:MAG: hypothetical protein WC860_07175, partial [Candidatus Margulisiibacteriota bacterium]